MTLTPGRSYPRSLFLGLIAVFVQATPLLADERDQANVMFNRLNGVPPSATTLTAMTQEIQKGDPLAAAMMAINDTAGMFYNLVLVNLVSQWTNTTNTPRVDLNDYTATIIGMVRDDVPFNQVLSGDLVYVADPTKIAGAPAYSLDNNDQYVYLQTAGANLEAVLVGQKQSEQTGGIPATATAGVITTRGFAEAFFKDGTNRRAAAFTFATFLCNNMNQLADTTRADFRVRRDVTRTPGGDAGLYHDKCAGCHAGMDGFAGAFAYYDVIDGATPAADQFVYNAGKVGVKYNRNSDQFPAGYVTSDDSWLNLWTQGPNSALDWQGPASGNGAKTFGTAVTSTDAFATCMATTAVTTMCLHAPTTAAELAAVPQIAQAFKQDFKLKSAFAAAAVTCATE